MDLFVSMQSHMNQLYWEKEHETVFHFWIGNIAISLSDPLVSGSNLGRGLS